SPVKIRGKVNCLPEMQLLFIGIVGFVVGLPSVFGQTDADYWRFYIIHAIGAIPAIIPLCYFALPESPKFLYLARKTTNAALKSIRYFSGQSAKCEEILKQYLEEQDQDERVTFRVGLKYVWKYRKAIFIGTLATGMTNFTGSWATYTFSTEIFITAG